MGRSRSSSGDGFAIVEVMIAITIMAVGVVSMVQLFAIATTSNRSSRTSTLTTMLAEQKMEQLRALAWGFDQAGAPVSDSSSNICVSPETPNGGVGLTVSPAGALRQNTPGYVDYVDGQGRWIGTGGTPVSGTVYVRRWSVEMLAGDPNTLVLQVLVTHRRQRGSADSGTVMRLPNEARLVSVKVRKPL